MKVTNRFIISLVISHLYTSSSISHLTNSQIYYNCTQNGEITIEIICIQFLETASSHSSKLLGNHIQNVYRLRCMLPPVDTCRIGQQVLVSFWHRYLLSV